jgi:hypothetical protein
MQEFVMNISTHCEKDMNLMVSPDQVIQRRLARQADEDMGGAREEMSRRSLTHLYHVNEGVNIPQRTSGMEKRKKSRKSNRTCWRRRYKCWKEMEMEMGQGNQRAENRKQKEELKKPMRKRKQERERKRERKLKHELKKPKQQWKRKREQEPEQEQETQTVEEEQRIRQQPFEDKAARSR